MMMKKYWFKYRAVEFSKKILKKASKWSRLKKISDNRFVASMYIWLLLVPIAAKILSELKEKIRFEFFGHHIILNTSLPFSWVVFFFSALFFTVANVIRICFCPKIINDHSDFSSFSLARKNHLHLQEYAEDIEHPAITLARFYEERSKKGQELYTDTYEAKIYDEFWELHRKGDEKYPVFRYLSFACYTIGFILIILVMSQNICFVVSSIF